MPGKEISAQLSVLINPHYYRNAVTFRPAGTQFAAPLVLTGITSFKQKGSKKSEQLSIMQIENCCDYVYLLIYLLVYLS